MSVSRREFFIGQALAGLIVAIPFDSQKIYPEGSWVNHVNAEAIKVGEAMLAAVSVGEDERRAKHREMSKRMMKLL